MNIKISTTIFVKWRLFKQRKGNEFHHRSLLQIIRCREVVQSRFWIVLKQRLKEPKMSWAFSVRLDSTLCPLKSIPFSERCVCSSKMFTIFYLCWLFFRQALLGFFSGIFSDHLLNEAVLFEKSFHIVPVYFFQKFHLGVLRKLVLLFIKACHLGVPTWTSTGDLSKTPSEDSFRNVFCGVEFFYILLLMGFFWRFIQEFL